MDWAMMVAKLGEASPTSDQVQLMIQRIKEFLVTINSHVEQETQTWISIQDKPCGNESKQRSKQKLHGRERLISP